MIVNEWEEFRNGRETNEKHEKKYIIYYPLFDHSTHHFCVFFYALK